MSSDTVHADPNDVRKLARALQHYEQQILQVSKDARRALDQANWHDSQKDKFEARYRDFHKKTTGFVGSEVKQMVKGLNALASDLDKARSQRF